MLETPSISRYSFSSEVPSRVRDVSSDNVSSAVNQQERLDPYIAGFVDGEGSFHVAVQRHPTTRMGWQLVPEFNVSQDVTRAEVLHLIRERLGCGFIRENHRGSHDTTLVFVVRRRADLLTKVIPFFERQPLISGKHREFVTLAAIVKAMAAGVHLEATGFTRLKDLALTMNGGGRYRRVHRPESSETIRRTSDAESGEEIVRPAWRHAEPSRNALAPVPDSDDLGLW
jgi:hypothetical protein